MQAAIRNSGFEYPPERVLISLSPADLRKEGAGFDLPVALGVLGAKAAADGATEFITDPILVMGELELSGKVRAVKGVHAAVATAAACGVMRCIVPVQNADEAREIAGVQVYGADSLENAFRALSDVSFYESRGTVGTGDGAVPAGCTETDGVYFPEIAPGYEYAELKGQRQLVRALQIAAAGGHNLIALGAPGCGKTMAIQKFPAINPVLTTEEAPVSYQNLVFSRAHQTKRTSHSYPTLPHSAPDRVHRRHLRWRPYLPSRRNLLSTQRRAVFR